MKLQIVILAAGKGKRMADNALPKILIPLKEKPVISYLLEELGKLSGVPSPVLVIGFKHSLVRKVLGKNYVYAYQRDQLGTAHAVLSAHEKISADNVLVLYGDMPFVKTASIKRLIELHRNNNAEISMFTCRVPNFVGAYESMNNFGRIIRDSYGNIVRITEFKDATEQERKIQEVNPGIYLFSTKWLWQGIDQIQNNNVQGEYYLTDIVEVAIGEGKKIHSLLIRPEEVFGINTKAQLDQAVKLLESGSAGF